MHSTQYLRCKTAQLTALCCTCRLTEEEAQDEAVQKVSSTCTAATASMPVRYLTNTPCCLLMPPYCLGVYLRIHTASGIIGSGLPGSRV